jgi:hypothetical protein
MQQHWQQQCAAASCKGQLHVLSGRCTAVRLDANTGGASSSSSSRRKQRLQQLPTLVQLPVCCQHTLLGAASAPAELLWVAAAAARCALQAQLLLWWVASAGVGAD